MMLRTVMMMVVTMFMFMLEMIMLRKTIQHSCNPTAMTSAALEEEKHWFSVKKSPPPQLQFLSAVVPPRGMGQGWH